MEDGKKRSHFASFFGSPADREFVGKVCVCACVRACVRACVCVCVCPIAQATNYCLLPDTFWLRALKNTFKDGIVNIANSLSPPSIVKKVVA